jgi:acylglycerol lipase
MISEPKTMGDVQIEEYDGIKFFYRHIQTNSDFGLIWIHGLGEHIDRYKPVFEVWSKKLEIIAFDQRGFGETVVKSNTPLGYNYGWDTVLDDVVHFAKKLKAKKIFIGGQSMGNFLN